MPTWIVAIILTVAVAGGAWLAGRHATRKPVPAALGLGHAGLALVGLVLLSMVVFGGDQPLAVNAALLLFAIALLGGAFLLLFRLQREPPPGFMVVLHGATALVGLALLWIGVGIG